MSYPSDLQDEEWKKIAIYFQPKSQRGKPREHAQKDIVNAILYVLKGGITWRMTCLRGKRFMIILAAGASAGYGKLF